MQYSTTRSTLSHRATLQSSFFPRLVVSTSVDDIKSFIDGDRFELESQQLTPFIVRSTKFIAFFFVDIHLQHQRQQILHRNPRSFNTRLLGQPLISQASSTQKSLVPRSWVYGLSSQRFMSASFAPPSTTAALTSASSTTVPVTAPSITPWSRTPMALYTTQQQNSQF